MPRPQKEAHELTDAEKCDRIQEDKNLPEKYRFVLFDDKREVALVWNGRTREVRTRKATRAWFSLAGRLMGPRSRHGANGRNLDRILAIIGKTLCGRAALVLELH